MEKNKRKCGDRYDARLVRSIDGMHTVMFHLMPDRTAAEVYTPDKLDVTELLRYIAVKNSAHPEAKINLFQCFVTALLRMVWEQPRINRFVQGRRIYERNDVTLSFICKLSFDEDAEETSIIVRARPDDTVDTIGARMRAEIRAAKQKTTEANEVDVVLNRLAKLPRPMLTALFGVLRRLDYHGRDLSALTAGDPNYCSVLLSNLGSIGMPAAYHHLNNYGTTSMVVTMGVVHKEEVILPDETKAIRDILDIGTTVDERVADGFAFALAVKRLKTILAHPEILDRPFSVPSGESAGVS